MSIRISKGRKGTLIHARGRDAQALFDAMCRSVGEPVVVCTEEIEPPAPDQPTHPAEGDE